MKCVQEQSFRPLAADGQRALRQQAKALTDFSIESIIGNIMSAGALQQPPAQPATGCEPGAHSQHAIDLSRPTRLFSEPIVDVVGLDELEKNFWSLSMWNGARSLEQSQDSSSESSSLEARAQPETRLDVCQTTAADYSAAQRLQGAWPSDAGAVPSSYLEAANKKLRPKKYQCPYCWVALSNTGQFRGHIRIHTGERPFKCDQPSCHKTFTRNEELTRHKRIHTGQRPYCCTLCNKRFGRKDHLKKHTRTHEKKA